MMKLFDLEEKYKDVLSLFLVTQMQGFPITSASCLLCYKATLILGDQELSKQILMNLVKIMDKNLIWEFMKNMIERYMPISEINELTKKKWNIENEVFNLLSEMSQILLDTIGPPEKEPREKPEDENLGNKKQVSEEEAREAKSRLRTLSQRGTRLADLVNHFEQMMEVGIVSPVDYVLVLQFFLTTMIKRMDRLDLWFHFFLKQDEVLLAGVNKPTSVKTKSFLPLLPITLASTITLCH
eukprot:TRINITY_DN5580_c0_g2_i4.p1 TRINITY_DN5580_c0_g2~~TRINITY_DN5580_c0_g2_i4.p1  ORF type:complete len:240 (-),score=53.62 TRINITY_DN5580_c0_g2_i4:1257-1976(-)